MQRILNYIKKSDQSIFVILNRRLSCWFMDIIMQISTQLGSLAFAVILPVILYLTGRGSLIDLAYRMVALLILSQTIVQIMKRLVNRPRPFKVLDDVVAKNIPACRYSFPSGHTCAAFSLAFALAGGIPGLSTVVFSLASLVGISRVYLGVHYPTDVLVGYATAYLCSVIL